MDGNSQYILVPGGLGFIGSHTVVELVAEHNENVIIVDNLDNSNLVCLERLQKITGKPDNIVFVNLDILNTEKMEEEVFSKYPIKSVIHFAALKSVGQSCKKPLEYYHNNVCGTVTMMQALQKYNIKCMVFSSSACVYGENPKCQEGDRIQPVNPYGQTKAMVEQIMKDTSIADPSFTAIALRYFNPIGAHPSGLIGESPNDIPNNLMPYILRVANGHAPFLGVFGNDYDTVDGTGVRDYIHVTDLAKAHVAALAKQSELAGYNTFNLGTGRGTSVLELVAAFESASGIKIPTQIQARRAGDTATCLAIPDKVNEVIGWKTELTIEDACRDNWKWCQMNPNGYEGELVKQE